MDTIIISTHVRQAIHYVDTPYSYNTEDHNYMYSLQNQKVKDVKCCTNITELVVVWYPHSVCTIVTKSKAVILYNTSCFSFAVAIARSRKIFVVYIIRSILSHVLLTSSSCLWF